MSDSKEPSADQAAFNWRAHLPVHPAAEMFPPLPGDELRAMGEDIRANGMHVPVVIVRGPEGDRLLDGRSRLDAMTAVGIKFKLELVAENQWYLRAEGVSVPDPDLFTEDQNDPDLPFVDPFKLVISHNLHRRHLNAEQRGEVVIQLLARQPSITNRQLGKELGVDPKTIGAARLKGEAMGRIPHKDRVEASGRRARGRRAGSTKKAETPVLTITGIKQRARALGVRVKSYGGTHGINVVYRDSAWGGLNLDGANARLDEIEREIGKPQTDSTGNDVNPDESAEAEKQKHAAAEETQEEREQFVSSLMAEVEPKVEPEVAADDAFDLWGALLSMTRTGKLDHTAIHTVVEEVRSNPESADLIRMAAAFYTAVVAELDKTPRPSDPDGGSKPDGETGSKDTEEPAPAGTVSIEEEVLLKNLTEAKRVRSAALRAQRKIYSGLEPCSERRRNWVFDAAVRETEKATAAYNAIVDQINNLRPDAPQPVPLTPPAPSPMPAPTPTPASPLVTPNCKGYRGRRGAYCGPTAMAAVTGEPITSIHDAVRQASGKILRADGSAFPVTGVRNADLVRAMQLLGWLVAEQWQEQKGEKPYTLDEFAKDCGNGGPFIVNVTGHYVAISQGEFCDPFTAVPKDLFGGVLDRTWFGGRKRKGSTWVRKWWRFERRAAADCAERSPMQPAAGAVAP
jgi:hypothetical protein